MSTSRWIPPDVLENDEGAVGAFPIGRLRAWVMAVAVVISTLTVFDTIFASWDEDAITVKAIVAVTLTAMVFAVAAGPVVHRRTGRGWIALVHLIAGAAGTFLLGIAILEEESVIDLGGNGPVVALMFGFPLTAFWMATAIFVGIGLAPERMRRERWIRRGGAGVFSGAIAMFGVLLSLVVYDDYFGLGTMSWGLFETAFIASLFAMGGGLVTATLVPVATALSRMAAHRRTTSIAPGARLEFDCPRCGTANEMPRGIGRCIACDTAWRVVIEEPQCRCGHVLFRLVDGQCPECGERIAGGDRFSESRFTEPDRPAAPAPPAAPGDPGATPPATPAG